MLSKQKAFILLGILFLTACAEKEDIVPGIRLDLRSAADVSVVANTNLSLPKAKLNKEWSHRNGSQSRFISHPSLSNEPVQIWSTKIGVGNKKRQRLAADPIVAENLIFTLDSNFGVTAFNLDGIKVWAADLTSTKSPKDKISGGGLAYSKGNLAVSTGSGEVVLMDAGSGIIQWRHDVQGSISAPPTFSNGIIIVMTGGNQAIALDYRNGRVIWTQESNTTGAGILGAGTPAISGDLAVLPFTSGEVLGVSLDDGLQSWSQVINGKRVGSANGFVKAVSGDPVIVGKIVYAGTNSGRLAAIDTQSGLRVWTKKEGAIGPVWIANNALFVLTDQQKLKRLDRKNGAEVWSFDLPIYRNPKRSTGKYGHYSPILAGGKLYVAGTDKKIRVFNPENGELINSISIRGGAASQIAVANDRMYIVSGSGKLIAFQ
ncbi:PQQ-binding-like beta-propeller repeat protein [Amylibacter sp.]|jgi:outer membrane protein assembly factor BamB|nr:PQQ-binding-like beta-propeller repeat protein [Amylibacter sp.]MDC1243373.1 PQQ-binding-like beta-propeller repeat protein [Amylibacter sp.]|tara:strand:- start:492 stop:1784 length:1293 start_codon:yes stop_codon:yes gene_type:complete